MSNVHLNVDARLIPGMPVEVRSRFDASWSRGFVVADARPNGYLVRRVSDGAVLPSAFPEGDLRPSS